MSGIKENLLSVSEVLMALAEKTDNLVEAINRLDGTLPELNAGPAEAAAVEKSPRKRVVPRNGVKRSAAGSGKKKLSDTDRVVKILKRAKTGVDVSTLKKKTGFNEKKVSNIVHRACKKGAIVRAGRGVYTVPG